MPIFKKLRDKIRAKREKRRLEKEGPTDESVDFWSPENVLLRQENFEENKQEKADSFASAKQNTKDYYSQFGLNYKKGGRIKKRNTFKEQYD